MQVAMIAATIKATGIWLLLVIAAILNGLLRELLLAPVFGPDISLPLSGITLSVLIFFITWLMIPFFGKNNKQFYFIIGLYWVLLTLCFEFSFAHFELGMSWGEISDVFDVMAGNFFVVALGVSALAPWLCARLRGTLLH